MPQKKNTARKKVLIMGLGLHGGGAGSARFFAKQGCRVIVTDLKSKKELAPSLTHLKRFTNIRYVLGRHRMKDFFTADLIIQGAGIPDYSPYLVAARKKHIPIDTDIGIFFELCPAPVIGVTGSKGKSTVASLIAAMLKKKFSSVFLAGNIRKSVLDILPRVTKYSIVVLELSSWQLEGLARHKKSPHIAIVTNVLREHLNKYRNFAHYARAKSFIFAFQKKDDYAIINKNDATLKKMARRIKSKIIFFGKTKTRAHNPALQGEHNAENIAAAKAVATLCGVSPLRQKIALEKFTGLEGRLQHIATKNGIMFYNDTTATMPDATIAALCTLNPRRNKRIILIAGGADKKLDFTKFAQEVTRRASIIIFLPGDATEKMKKLLRKQIPQKLQGSPMYDAASMKNAVKIAYSLAKKGDIILLSPGAASFGLFQNEFDRGAQFATCVRKLNKKSKMSNHNFLNRQLNFQPAN